MKLNSNAAFRKDEGLADFRMVVRDSEGRVLMFSGGKRLLSQPVDLIEAQALLFALHLAYEVCFITVKVEIDCLSIVKALNSPNRGLAPLDLLIEDIRQFALNFQFISFAFVPRQCNNVAHVISQWATGLDVDSVFYGGCSSCS